jgi:hypothetical protein
LLGVAANIECVESVKDSTDLRLKIMTGKSGRDSPRGDTMKTIDQQLDKPYAAPQADLSPLHAAAEFSRAPIGVRSKIFWGSLKFGFYCGCLFCLLLLLFFLAEAIKSNDFAKTLHDSWLLVIYWVYMLMFASMLGASAGFVLMILDLLLQVLGLREPAESETGAGRFNLRPRHLLIDLVRE